MNVPETFSLRIARPSATWPFSCETTEKFMRFWAGSVRPAEPARIVHRRMRFIEDECYPVQTCFSTFRPAARRSGGGAGYGGVMEGTSMMLTMWVLAATLGTNIQPAAAPQRFDYLVRADFFAGAAGDDARLAKVMAICENALEQNPNHAEAHVWHGAGLLVRAGRAFQAGDTAAGGPLFDRGVKEMNDAAALAPDNPGVLIPRGAVLLEATRNMPPPIATPLLESALRNYEHALDVQGAAFNTLGDHAKGELLFGLAEGWSRLGDVIKARRYFDRLIADAPTSGQTSKARAWIETGTVPTASGAQCVGCHK